MKRALRVLEVLAVTFALAVATGFLVWEWPRDPVLHYAELELESLDVLAIEGRVMWGLGVERWNGSSLAAGLTEGVYVYGDEIFTVEGETYSGHAVVRAPKGPTTDDADFWRDSDAAVRYRLDANGDLERITIRGVDEVSGRPFWIHTTRRMRGALRLELETWGAQAQRLDGGPDA